jgi:hypothetical protein
MKHFLSAVLACVLAFALSPAFAQGKPAAADNMQILRDKLKADKKLVVAANMELTEAESKAFWPVYDDYQKELAKINTRTGDLIKAYAKEYNAGSLTDDKAKKMTDELIAIEDAEVKMKRAFVPKLAKVLPGKKVARYLQIETKIRAVIKYELADGVPLVQ